MKQLDPQYETAVPLWAPLIIRLAVGLVFLAHGSQKVFGAFGGPGMEPVVGMVRSLGFHPAIFWAWLLALVELLGGAALIVGLLTRLAALGIAVDMLVAIFKVHGPNGFFLQNKGYEYPMVLLAAALSLVIGGAGRASLDWFLRGIVKRKPRI